MRLPSLLIGLVLLFLSTASGFAQEGPAEPSRLWFRDHPAQVTWPGVSVDHALQNLLQGRTPSRPVIVAIIDSGVDVEHDALRNHLWTNPGEIPGNGVDDDGNGYVDDVHGWNFIGGADGQNVVHDSYEVAREFARLRTRYTLPDTLALTAAQRDTLRYFEQVRDELSRRRAEGLQALPNITRYLQVAEEAYELVRSRVGERPITIEVLSEQMQTSSDQRLGALMNLYMNDLDLDDLRQYVSTLRTQVNYHFNPAFDPRDIVGDDPNNLDERHYGNADVIGPDAEHGTHVAGLVAAQVAGEAPIGIAAGMVRIMAIRAVPDGDERDKDVANAIRYAVDNGAHIINMSFGKGYSPHRETVEAAVRYAEERGVLLVHAAGNSAQNIDENSNFPTPFYADGTRAPHWIEVGAATWDGSLAASFSNYGARTVDLFAPGDYMYSPVPGQQYAFLQGTSMAAPVVSGVAALVWAHYPNLTAAQLREVLMASVTSFRDATIPFGENEEEIAFGTLSVTGGIVNAYHALREAERRSR